ncbi:hypothetical protein ACOBQJ_04740 [Pelotomaculum propionicicum]|uniref:hypothetical protein n=1 Tax=Pelotomaculum propionicicum TaxID=258475 RepID=UPI003B7CFFC0
MKHTFLFEEGVWISQGTYYDENNNKLNVEGRSEITHKKKLWINKSSMTLPGDNPVVLSNDYEIAPFVNDVTGWKSVNPGLGTLIGRFAVIDDSILSLYSSESGEYFGTEFLTQVSESEYIGKGVLYSAAGKVSSWSVRLEKVPG